MAKLRGLAGTPGQKAKLLAIKDRNGNTLTMTYSGSNLATVKDDLNRALTFTYNGNNRITQVSVWSGRQLNYEYDSNGNLSAFKNSLASAGSQDPVSYTYYTTAEGPNLNHAMKSYQLPRGNGMTFEYYANGKVFKHYTTLGETSTFTYNDFRRETAYVDERGLERRFFFDENGNPLQVQDEQGSYMQAVGSALGTSGGQALASLAPRAGAAVGNAVVSLIAPTTRTAATVTSKAAATTGSKVAGAMYGGGTSAYGELAADQMSQQPASVSLPNSTATYAPVPAGAGSQSLSTFANPPLSIGGNYSSGGSAGFLGSSK